MKTLSDLVKIVDKGEKNIISVKTKESSIRRINITIEGNNNEVFIEEGGTNVTIDLHIKGDNNLFFLDKDYRTIKTNVLLFGEDQRITIGKYAHIGGCGLNAQENTSIEIGDNALIAYQTDIRTTDSHSVIDNKTGQRINPAASVKLGDRVWVATQVIISKGVELKNDIIVGAKALVTKSFDQSNIMIGGVPAKIIKEDVSWALDKK